MRRILLLLWLSLLVAFPACAEDEMIVFDDEFNAFYQRFYDQQETDIWSEEIPEAEMLSEGEAPTAAPVEETAAPQATFVYSRTLKYGMTGDDVAQLQTRLAELGYFTERVTGGYYKKTSAAVKAFQKQNALSTDGVAGKETLTALFDDALAVPADATPRPTATPMPPQYHLFVDVTNQITRAYALDAQGEYTVLVREMICSTGTKSNPTPIKTCTLPGKRARWGYFPEWGSHAQYLTRIDSSNAFHSVLYSSANEKALVVSSFEKLGERASHGCVRLLVDDAKWIYENCPAGTPVTIFEGEYDPEYTMALKPAGLNRDTMLPYEKPAPTPAPVYDGVNVPAYTHLLKQGVETELVYHVQMRLKELGYYSGTVTGGYYGGTIAAVKAFQKNNGLSADGITGEKTYAALFAAHPMAADGTPYEEAVFAPGETPIPEGLVEEYTPMTPVPVELRVTPMPSAPAPTATPMPTPVATPEPTDVPPEMLDPEWLGGAVG